MSARWWFRGYKLHGDILEIHESGTPLGLRLRSGGSWSAPPGVSPSSPPESPSSPPPPGGPPGSCRRGSPSGNKCLESLGPLPPPSGGPPSPGSGDPDHPLGAGSGTGWYVWGWVLSTSCAFALSHAGTRCCASRWGLGSKLKASTNRKDDGTASFTPRA